MEDNIIKILQDNSTLSKKSRDDWKLISNGAIRRKKVQPLTPSGLLQVINRAAYEIATTTHICIMMGVSDEEWERITEQENVLLDEIQFTAALASGIHPQIITDAIHSRVDHYLDRYIEMLEDDNG